MGKQTYEVALMLLGIDVGGTFTDAVLANEGKIVNQAKVLTTRKNILEGILKALDSVLIEQSPCSIDRVVISSTVVTNALVIGDIDEVLLVVMPGTGMDILCSFPVTPVIVDGYVDHRGKITAPVNVNFAKLEAELKGKSIAVASGKFSVRNPQNELMLKKEIAEFGIPKIFLGSEMSGELNFVRRTNSAYFSAAVFRKYQEFIDKVKESITSRGITAPVHILKADGGTLPLSIALKHPVEAIFTGPAASVLGIEALALPRVQAVSLDVGGTTTDIAFWDNAKPLLANKGAQVKGFPTSVRAYHMRSVSIGGDSLLKRQGEKFLVGPERKGQAAALGGESATLGDALIVLAYVSFGDLNKAQNAILKLCHDGETITAVAGNFVKVAVDKLEQNIIEMIHEWEIKPVYTVNDVISGTKFKPEVLIGVGGGAAGLIQRLGIKMNLPVTIPIGAVVANAVGAALARPTLNATLRADSIDGYYVIPEGGIRERIPCQLSRMEVETLLSEWLLNEAKRCQIEVKGIETVAYEEFNTIQNYYSMGKIVYLKMQLKTGIVYNVDGQEVAF